PGGGAGARDARRAPAEPRRDDAAPAVTLSLEPAPSRSPTPTSRRDAGRIHWYVHSHVHAFRHAP
ncbi:hypothetical protein, partial [Burkholderia pseudomallei]|uniref:hypothetical protein n=2 Tax=Burkholderia pseudomallei TaxID=28450 RepID=UPI0029314349